MTLCNSAQIVQQMKHNYWCRWHWLSLWNSQCWLWDFAVLPANPRNAILAFRCISCEINVWIVLQVCGSNVNNLSAPDTFQSWHSLSRTWTAAVHSGPADLSPWPDTISTSDSRTLRVRWINNMRLSFGPRWTDHCQAGVKIKTPSHVYSHLTESNISLIESNMRK